MTAEKNTIDGAEKAGAVSAPDDIAALEQYAAPRKIYDRIRHHYQKVNDYNFFPKFMAAKGGITAVTIGLFMLPSAIAVSSLVTASILVTTAIGLVSFGAFSAIKYGGKMIGDLKRQFDHKVLKKPMAPPRSERKTPDPEKPVASPWMKLQKSRGWTWFTQARFTRAIEGSKAFQAVKRLPVWNRVADVTRDQEVLLRAFATGGSLATVGVATAIIATQAVALPAITVSFAFSLTGIALVYTAASLVTAVIAAGHYSTELIKSTQDAVRQSIHKNRKSRAPALPSTAPQAILAPSQIYKDMLAAKAAKPDFSKSAAKPAANDDHAPAQNSQAKKPTPKEQGSSK